MFSSTNNGRGRRRIISAAIVVFFLALTSATACYAATSIITQQELLQKLESGAALLILDVRTVGEYRSGHVPQAINIPHNQLANRLNELLESKDQELVTYCEQGPRAGFAESVLQKAGFSAVRHLEGDMYAWRRNALPIVQP